TTDKDPIGGSGLGIGSVPYGSKLDEIQLFVEGDAPKPIGVRTSLAGDILRGFFGTSLRYGERYIPLRGTAQTVRRRNEVIKQVEAAVGSPAVEFEELLVRSQYGGLPSDVLREYAQYRRESAAAPASAGGLHQREAVDYWGRMEKLVDAPIDQVITQA